MRGPLFALGFQRGNLKLDVGDGLVNDSGVLTPAIGLTGVKLYHVVGDTITEMAAADLVVGDYVVVYSENGEITEIYVYDAAPATPIAP